MIKNKITQLRDWLKKNKFEAIIIPTNDPHFSEYVAQYWKSREWISGFTGSAGTVVITRDKALLWCDSRYFVQSELELDKTIFSIQKMGINETPTINEWLNGNIKKGGRIAVDGTLFSIVSFENMASQVSNCVIEPISDPFISMWDNRPKMPESILRIIDEKDSGESVQSKRKRVIEELQMDRNSIYITTMLDEIAWLLNIRGADVEFNPVIISYVIVSYYKITLFINNGKIISEDYDILKSLDINIEEYNNFDNYLLNIKGLKVIVNRDKFDIYHYKLLKSSGVEIEIEKGDNSVITTIKAVKNEVELRGIRRAMMCDGVALVKFNMWLEEVLNNGNEVTEFDISTKLHECRMYSPTFMGDSFNAIVGYKSNGAIVHYSPSEKESSVIRDNGFLLIDSGGQYKYGTTDITRTIHLSAPIERERVDYTLVLKGNISLTTAVFPAGTCGFQLDILARQHLLKNGLNYMHGTGHGLGHYLNVHEGPQSIRMNYNPTAIVPGMITSNEPGIYREGEYGIRLENIIECVKHSSSEFGVFYKFQTITLFPFDLKCINIGMLTTEERHWLNRYHSKVFDKLSQFLNTDERLWLSNKTKAI